MSILTNTQNSADNKHNIECAVLVLRAHLTFLDKNIILIILNRNYVINTTETIHVE